MVIFSLSEFDLLLDVSCSSCESGLAFLSVCNPFPAEGEGDRERELDLLKPWLELLLDLELLRDDFPPFCFRLGEDALFLLLFMLLKKTSNLVSSSASINPMPLEL